MKTNRTTRTARPWAGAMRTLPLACLALAAATCDRAEFTARGPSVGQSDGGALPDGVYPDLVTLTLTELVSAFEAYAGPPGFTRPFFIVEDALYGFPPPPPLPPGWDPWNFTLEDLSRVPPAPTRKTHLAVPTHLDEALRKAGEWTRRQEYDIGHPERRRWREYVDPSQLSLVLADVRDCDDRKCAMEWYPWAYRPRPLGLTSWWVKAIAVPGGWTLAEPIVLGAIS